MSWPLVALKDCCTVVGGATPRREVESYWDSKDVPWVTPKDISKINSLYINDAPEYISNEGFDSCAACKLPIGSLLLTSRAPIGNIAITTKEMCTNQGFKSLIPSYKVDVKYLYFCMLHSAERLENEGNGATFKEVSKKIVEAFKIPLPPLETQKQIAAVLEKADQLRKDCQQMEQELNSLAQSVFIEMFGDPATNPKGWKIGTIAELLSSANYGTSEKSSTDILKYPVLRMNNITYEGNWDFTSLKYMDMDEKDEDKYLVQDGDILFNRTNSKELVGKTAVYREKEPMAYAGYLVRARCNKFGHPDYISSFMNSKYGKQTLQTMCKSIVGMANINAKEFQSIKIAKPPIELQIDFSVRIAKIRALIQEVKLQDLEYQKVFNALMQKAFSGEHNFANVKTS
ncbi:restriction endonuclease subunit S [Shewanella sp. SM72]|uniref:restriction endonuclease subunit S n=1 Tax=Shewanella TaxID=22 RepID=UPI0021DA2A86|nr:MULTISPECIES: restriction endonuclease subunit S [unclassified Shewanella]MCU8019071.1 restriction endonuclease subunit S [Shewanella sp. SM72]MCU8031708.1 restriction endonuclease subunit S [Shewanella sp. SM73]